MELGVFEEAITAFQEVLPSTFAAHGDMDSNRNAGTIGVTAALAEAYLAVGREDLAMGYKLRSRASYLNALDMAYRILSAGQHALWSWKIIGDAAFELAAREVTPEESRETFRLLEPILTYLVEADGDRKSHVEGVGHAANILQASADSASTLRTAVAAYAYRAFLCQNERRSKDSAHYDLASALLALAQRSKRATFFAEKREANGNSSIDGMYQACIREAMSAVRAGLERDAGNERLWNALGVLAAEGDGNGMAQHAFVVALEIYPKVEHLFLRVPHT